MIIETDLSYAAGIIDGEGTIAIFRRKPRRNKGKTSAGDRTPRYDIYTTVTMSDRKVIYWLKDTFGGSILPLRKYEGHHKSLFRWHLFGESACILLKLIEKYLKTKGLQAIIAMNFYETLIRKKGWQGVRITEENLKERNRLWGMMKLLNQGYDPEIEGGYNDH